MKVFFCVKHNWNPPTEYAFWMFMISIELSHKWFKYRKLIPAEQIQLKLNCKVTSSTPLETRLICFFEAFGEKNLGLKSICGEGKAFTVLCMKYFQDRKSNCGWSCALNCENRFKVLCRKFPNRIYQQSRWSFKFMCLLSLWNIRYSTFSLSVSHQLTMYRKWMYIQHLAFMFYVLSKVHKSI